LIIKRNEKVEKIAKAASGIPVRASKLPFGDFLKKKRGLQLVLWYLAPRHKQQTL